MTADALYNAYCEVWRSLPLCPSCAAVDALAAIREAVSDRLSTLND